VVGDFRVVLLEVVVSEDAVFQGSRFSGGRDFRSGRGFPRREIFRRYVFRGSRVSGGDGVDGFSGSFQQQFLEVFGGDGVSVWVRPSMFSSQGFRAGFQERTGFRNGVSLDTGVCPATIIKNLGDNYRRAL
jgi:hypothetical protein